MIGGGGQQLTSAIQSLHNYFFKTKKLEFNHKSISIPLEELSTQLKLNQSRKNQF